VRYPLLAVPSGSSLEEPCCCLLVTTPKIQLCAAGTKASGVHLHLGSLPSHQSVLCLFRRPLHKAPPKCHEKRKMRQRTRWNSIQQLDRSRSNTRALSSLSGGFHLILLLLLLLLLLSSPQTVSGDAIPSSSTAEDARDSEEQRQVPRGSATVSNDLLAHQSSLSKSTSNAEEMSLLRALQQQQPQDPSQQQTSSTTRPCQAVETDLRTCFEGMGTWFSRVCDGCVAGALPPSSPSCEDLGTAMCAAVYGNCPCGLCADEIEKYLDCAFMYRVGCPLQCD